jgi:hypothetical protein
MNPPQPSFGKGGCGLWAAPDYPTPNFGKALLIVRRNPIIGSRCGEMIALPVVSIDTEIMEDATYPNSETEYFLSVIRNLMGIDSYSVSS